MSDQRTIEARELPPLTLQAMERDAMAGRAEQPQRQIRRLLGHIKFLSLLTPGKDKTP